MKLTQKQPLLAQNGLVSTNIYFIIEKLTSIASNSIIEDAEILYSNAQLFIWAIPGMPSLLRVKYLCI